jgi:hypothetical protein
LILTIEQMFLLLRWAPAGIIRTLGDQISALILAARLEDTYALLSPLLLARTPFRLLDATGAHVQARGEAVNTFLDRIAAERTEGGWVVQHSPKGKGI